MLAGCSNSSNSKPKETKKVAKVEKKKVTKKKPKEKKKEVTINNSNKINQQNTTQEIIRPTQLDPKVICVMQELYTMPDEFKEAVKDGKLVYSVDEDPHGRGFHIYNIMLDPSDESDNDSLNNDLDGYNNIDLSIRLFGTTDDDLAVDGNGSAIKLGSDGTDVLVKNLINDYYKNKDQQDEVNYYASLLK